MIPFYVFAADIRKIIYTTNAIESLHMQRRKIIKARGHFPSDESALKLIWLALRDVVAKWTGSRHDWKSAMAQFALLYPERFSIGNRDLTRFTHEIPDTTRLSRVGRASYIPRKPSPVRPGLSNPPHSTVTDFARFLGLSISAPRKHAA